MSSRYNEIENTIKNGNVDNLTNEQLIHYLYISTKNDELKIYDESKLEDYLYKINYSFFYENIFTNTGNYSQISIYIIGLLIPFYINYPRFYNLGGLGFFIGIISFLLLYQYINNLYGVFFPLASKIFILLSIIFYFIFFVLFNKLNHISLFFISSIVSFCIINYLYKIFLTLPISFNKYNKLNVKLNNNKDFKEYDNNIEEVCKEVIKRFGLKLPSGRMLYSYLTVFEIGESNTLNKILDFLNNLIAPIITLYYNHYLGNFLETITNKEYHDIEYKVIPLVGNNDLSKSYISCQANYVLPIEFNLNSYIHEYFTESKLDDKTYRIFLKALKRINNELIEKYQPKFIKLEDLDPETLKKHLQESKKDKNHILIQLQKYFQEKKLDFNFDNDDYIYSIRDYINTIPNEKEKDEAMELYHKINQTLLIKTNYEFSNEINNNLDNIFIDNSKLAIEVLLENPQIKDDKKILLKNLCTKYVEDFLINIKQERLYGYNYNILTYSYFNRETRLKSNKWFFNLIKIISTYILFGRPITSPWMLSTFILLPYIKFSKYFKSLSKNNIIMKYLSIGIDNEYFINNYDNNIENNSITEKSMKLGTKVLLYLLFSTPFLQFFNNVFYGQTFQPLYINMIYQVVFIFNLIGNIYSENIGLNKMSFNVIFWIVFFIVTIILYFLLKKK